MDFYTYQKLAKRTLPTLGSKKLDLAHLVLGMNTEIEELEQALNNNDTVNISEEIADYMWYLANYMRLREIPLQELRIRIYGSKGLIGMLYNRTSKLQDLIKKYIAYDKNIDTKNEISILSQIYGILMSFRIDMPRALENNINKLKVRYPDKFDKEKAINRDTETERQELEK